MNTYITRRQIREANRKLFANDLVYDEKVPKALEEVISLIMQRYDPKDKLENVPSILKINRFDSELLNSIMLLNKKSVIIQVNNELLSNKAVLDFMQQLKTLKYKIAVELNRQDKQFTIATILADIIRMDINNIPDILQSSGMHLGYNGKVMISNIDSPADYEVASAIHADLFEGNYITEGSSIKIESAENSEPINFIEIIQILSNEDNIDIKNLAEAISRDVIMTAQVIRLANSGFFAGTERISSVEQAIIRIGLDTLKKWVFLLQFNRRTNNNDELLQLAYSRALFCEGIARRAKNIKIEENDAYLIGLFSTLDALMGKSIDKQINSMNLSSVIEDALVYREGVGGTVLNLVKSYEEANWARVEKYAQQIGIAKNDLSNIYFKCIDEVSRFWSSLMNVEA